MVQKVNFNDNVGGSRDDASFVIRGTSLELMAARESHLYEPTIIVAELHGAWTESSMLRGFCELTISL